MKIKHNNTLIPILNVRQISKDKKVVTVGVVTSINDSYDTVIDPDGCLSPLESVVIDYNHNRISSGAKIIEWRKSELVVPSGNGGEKTVTALVADIEVYRDSKMLRVNPDPSKPAIDEGSLYDAVENGRVGWVSVDFDPIKTSIQTLLDYSGNKVSEIYRQWRLNFLSFLDTKPGQDTSYILNIRQLNFNKRTPMLTEMKQQITQMLDGMNVKVSSIDNVEMEMTSDTEGTVEFLLNGNEPKQVSYSMDTKGAMKFSNFANVDPEEEEKEDGSDESAADENVEDKTKTGEGDSNVAATSNEETQKAAEEANASNEKKAVAAPDEKNKSLVNDEIDPNKKPNAKRDNKRAYIGCVVKNAEGNLMGVVTGKLQIEEGEEKIDQVKIKLADGSEQVINDSDISYGDSMPENAEEMAKPWQIASDGDVFMYFVGLNNKPVVEVENTNQDMADEDRMDNKDTQNGLMNVQGEEQGKLGRKAAEEANVENDENEENKEFSRQLKEKDDKLIETKTKYNNLVKRFNRLANSPSEAEPELDSTGSVDDLTGESAEKDQNRKKDFGEEVTAAKIRSANRSK